MLRHAEFLSRRVLVKAEVVNMEEEESGLGECFRCVEDVSGIIFNRSSDTLAL